MTNSKLKLFLDLNESTQIKTSTLSRLCLIKVSVRSYSARGRYNPKVNWAGTRLVWLLRQRYQLQYALSEIVSLVSLSLLQCCYVACYCHYVRMFTLRTFQYDFLLLSLFSCCYVATRCHYVGCSHCYTKVAELLMPKSTLLLCYFVFLVHLKSSWGLV